MSTVDELLALTRQVASDVSGVRRTISNPGGDLTGLQVPDASTLVQALNLVYARSGRTGPAGRPGAPSFIPGPAGRDGIDGAPVRYGADGVDGADGAPGRDGAPGATGPAGVTSATALSLPAGSSATASVSNGVLSLGIPRGDTGAQGTPGTNGTNGAKGDTGATGPAGVTSATANTLAAGSAATASLSGGVLTIGVPIGPKGDTGATGAQGTPGTTGATGAKGDTGATGATGPAGTFTGYLINAHRIVSGAAAADIAVNGTDTPIPFLSINNDSASYYTLANGKITVLKAGLYTIAFRLFYKGNSTAGYRQGSIVVNGAAILQSGSYSSDGGIRPSGNIAIRLNANDVVALSAYANAASIVGASNIADTGITIVYLGN